MGDYESVVKDNPHLGEKQGKPGEDGGSSSLQQSSSAENLLNAAKQASANGPAAGTSQGAGKGAVDKKKPGAKPTASTLSNKGEKGNLTNKEGRKAGQVDRKV